MNTRPLKERLLPAEWAAQCAVLLAWPADTGDFASRHADVQRVYVDIAREISLRQFVIIATDAHSKDSIQRQLNSAGADNARVRFVRLDYDDVWVRDTAPLSVLTPQEPALVNFAFNGWGGKYTCDNDARIGLQLMESGLFKRFTPESLDFVLEGGSIESDGAGTLLTTRFCLMNPNRNPSCVEADVESVLRDRLGAERILWLNHGHVAGDDTDAHVDTLARFCDEETIAYTSCDDPADEHYASLNAMAAELREFHSISGKPYQLVPLPIPQPIRDETGKRLPATYANFLIINGAVLLPVYDDARDAIAIENLRACFPSRDIVTIDCRPLIQQYGSLHCMTMQFPAPIGLKCQ